MSGKIVHFEINGPDEQALASFYTDVFGWQVQPQPQYQYGLVATGEGSLGGGIGRMEDGSGPVIYIEVDRLDEALKSIAARGGSTVVEPTVVPGMVKFAQFKDPAGNVIGLVEAGEPPSGRRSSPRP
jgi:predicted enzyme related to lactoylglutathione lyase